jgi:YD repeat-containing protein
MHYMYNGHRDVVALINEIGQIEATYYDAFGNIEEETGLYYLLFSSKLDNKFCK